MPDQEDIEAQQRLLRAHRRTLNKLLEQRALLGAGHAPPGLLIGIEEAQKEILQVKVILRQWGHEIEDLPDDADDLIKRQNFVTPTPLREPVGDFVGREQEIERLTQALTIISTRGAIVAICGVRGMGGLGKTELAYAMAQRLAVQFPDGQVFIDLQGADKMLPVDAVLRRVLRGLSVDVDLQFDVDRLQSKYRSTLTGKRLLIIADNARDAAQVRPLVPPIGSALLITTRHRFVVPGMVVEDLRTLPPGEAQQLLIAICRRIGAAAPILAKRCGYLPLALRVSASMLANDDALRVEHYLDQLVDARTKLAYLRDPEDPDLDVEASLRLSYDTLDLEAKKILNQLSILPSSFAASTVSFVVDHTSPVESLLSTLRRRSLIEWNEATQQYELHDLVRALAAKELDPQQISQLEARSIVWRAQQQLKATLLPLTDAEEQTAEREVYTNALEEMLLWLHGDLEAVQKLDWNYVRSIQFIAYGVSNRSIKPDFYNPLVVSVNIVTVQYGFRTQSSNF